MTELTTIDTNNYAAMAIMLMDEKNTPVEKPSKYDDEFIENNLTKNWEPYVPYVYILTLE